MYTTNGFLITTLTGLIILANVDFVNTSESSNDLPQNDNSTESHNAITGFFIIILVSCVIILLLIIVGLCCFFRSRNEINSIDLAFAHSEESIRMSVKAQREKSCTAINIPDPFPKVHSQSVPIPKVRSQSCSDFIPHDEAFRQSHRPPPKKPNINIIIGEEVRHCTPYPVPEKMSRRNTVGSRPGVSVRVGGTFQCPGSASKNPFQRQMSLPASTRSHFRSQGNPFKLNDQIQSCPFT